MVDLVYQIERQTREFYFRFGLQHQNQLSFAAILKSSKYHCDPALSQSKAKKL